MSKERQDEDTDFRVSQQLLAERLRDLRQSVDELKVQMRALDKQVTGFEASVKVWGAVAGLIASGIVAVISSIIIAQLK